MASLKIAGRLGLGFVLVFVLLIGLLVTGFRIMERLNSDLNDAYKLNSNKINLAYHMLADIQTIDLLTRDVLLEEDQSLKLDYVNKIEIARSEYHKYFNQLKELEENKEGLALLTLIANNLEKAVDYNNKITQLGLAGDVEQGTILLNSQSKPLMTKIQDQLEILVGIEEKNIQEQYAQQAKNFYEARNTMFGVAGVIILIGIVIAFIFARSISHPVSQLARAADLASSGDLTVDIPVKSRDEVGILAESFRKMVVQVRDLVGQIMEKAHTVAGSAGQLTASAQQTAAGANESSAAMSQISSTVERVSANINQIKAASDSASGFAAKGAEGISRFTGQMQIIAGSAGEAAAVIDGFSVKSREIGQIVELITDIAEQTNLLALNAAIEAARAGEQGRGFAVVAEEVRKLAEQSADAAKEIYGLVNAIQLESQKAVDIMAQGGKNVAEGDKVVQEVGQNFKDIIGAVQGLNGQISEVATAAGQMASGIQVAVASTEEQTASMEEVSASAESLNNLAADLTALVKKFKV